MRYLIGLSRALPGIFDHVDWGSDRVLMQLRTNADRLGLSVMETAGWYDIDRMADLRRAIDDSRQAADGRTPTRLLLALESAVETVGAD